MKKIYVVHSSGFDYKELLYKPIRDSGLNQQFEIVLPHEDSAQPIHSKDLIKSCDFMVAEVSYPSTGMGIELGWADSYNKPIYAIHQANKTISSSLKLICHKLVAYQEGELINALKTIL